MKKGPFIYLISILGVTMLLTSCTSVPLSTMMKLRGFSLDDFVALDPNEVLLKVVLPEPLQVEPDNTKIEVAFLYNNGDTQTYAFPLELVNVEEETRGWRHKTIWRYFILQITSEGKQDVVNIQRELKRNKEAEKHGQMRINAMAGFKELPPEQMPEKATLSIQLQFNERDGFFTMIDEAEINFKKDEKQGH